MDISIFCHPEMSILVGSIRSLKRKATAKKDIYTRTRELIDPEKKDRDPDPS